MSDKCPGGREEHGMNSMWQYHCQRQSEDEEIMATIQRNHLIVTKLQAVGITEKAPEEAVLDHSNSVHCVCCQPQIVLIVVCQL